MIRKYMRLLRNFFTGRIFLSLLCLGMAAFCAFVLLPGIYKDQSATVSLVRVKEQLEVGTRLEARHVEVVEVGSYNLPPQAVMNPEEVLGFYTATKLYPGDFLFPAKLSQERLGAGFDHLISSGKQLVTVTPKNAAQALASHLQKGDIVSIAIISEARQSTGELQRLLVYPLELSQLEVFAVENQRGTLLQSSANGRDTLLLASAQGGVEDLIPKTITFMVDAEQSALLLQAEYNGGFHIIFQERRP
ncbi:MAG: SAF domain-containing protein [Symbiobacteriaceae bacterium]|nr:SAF domain-containing protein [Symbiobacteriaceae bacterium]